MAHTRTPGRVAALGLVLRSTWDVGRLEAGVVHGSSMGARFCCSNLQHIGLSVTF